MSKPIDVLRYIEENYRVEDIKVNGFQVWQVLRRCFIDEYEKEQERINNSSDISNSLKTSVINKITIKICNLLWNITKIKKNHKYILFTDRLEERVIDGYISDKIAHNLLQICGEDILLITNQLNLMHRENKDYMHKQNISSNIFEIKRLLKKVSFNIENEEILIKIIKEHNINFNYNKILDDFFRYVEVFDKYLEKKKPEFIFVNCYYTVMHQALIYASHKNSIKIIELQHGIINSNHYAYNIFKDIGKETFANYLFVFGDYFKNIVKSNYIEKNNIYSIGNFYIENSLSESLSNKGVKDYFYKLREEYSKIIVVTSQEPVETRLINFLKECAEIDRDIIYVFIPRNFNKDFKKYELPQNIIINEKIDFYHTVGYCDYHATVYSTCALEALCFGIPNILININNLSKDNLYDMLEESSINFYAEEPEEFINWIINNSVDKNEVKSKGQQFYLRNNKENIKYTIGKIK
jgi:hypothetical protein